MGGPTYRNDGFGFFLPLREVYDAVPGVQHGKVHYAGEYLASASTMHSSSFLLSEEKQAAMISVQQGKWSSGVSGRKQLHRAVGRNKSSLWRATGGRRRRCRRRARRRVRRVQRLEIGRSESFQARKVRRMESGLRALPLGRGSSAGLMRGPLMQKLGNLWLMRQWANPSGCTGHGGMQEALFRAWELSLQKPGLARRIAADAVGLHMFPRGIRSWGGSAAAAAAAAAAMPRSSRACHANVMVAILGSISSLGLVRPHDWASPCGCHTRQFIQTLSYHRPIRS
jgi:hypothetical protein